MLSHPIPPLSVGVNKGVGTATLFASFFLGYALAFWFGTKLVADDLEAGCENDCATGVSSKGSESCHAGHYHYPTSVHRGACFCFLLCAFPGSELSAP